jgi:hypothetical protein
MGWGNSARGEAKKIYENHTPFSYFVKKLMKSSSKNVRGHIHTPKKYNEAKHCEII